MKKIVPFTQAQASEWIRHYPTPFYVYDEKGIREVCRSLNAAFSWAPQFKEYFAVKALPNPSILRVLKEEGLGADCSSLAELLLAEKVGMKGEEIMFTANDVPAEDFQKARELGAIINIDDITHIEFLERVAGLPDLLCFRFNPGPLREGNAIIGKPEEAKYGLTKEQLFEAYKIAKEKGVKRFGLHTMIASNELDANYFVQTASMLFDLVDELSKAVGIEFEFINMGGGIGIPYRPEQEVVNLATIGHGVASLYQEKCVTRGYKNLRITMECGRVITGPYGYLVTTAIHRKHIYRDYIGVDACMANLMRPGMYGAYHHITVLGKEDSVATHTYDVTGALCENNDKFAIDRVLPEIAMGDILVIHDAGAHGHAMGFNYNGKLRSAEFLLQLDGTIKMIRRAETIADHFATLEF